MYPSPKIRFVLGLLLVTGGSFVSGSTSSHAEPPPSGDASNPCPIDADLWLLGGQSNMVGAEIVAAPGEPDPRIVMLNMDGHWIPAVDPIHRYYEATDPAYRDFTMSTVATDEQRAQLSVDLDRAREESLRHPIGGYGSGLPFAKHVLANTGRSVGLIPCAQGSTSMATWDPAPQGQGDAFALRGSAGSGPCCRRTC